MKEYNSVTGKKLELMRDDIMNPLQAKPAQNYAVLYNTVPKRGLRNVFEMQNSRSKASVDPFVRNHTAARTKAILRKSNVDDSKHTSRQCPLNIVGCEILMQPVEN